MILLLLLGSEIIYQGIELQTELGANAQDILLRGEAIPEEVCAKVLLDKISSPEVAHHGTAYFYFKQLALRLLKILNFYTVYLHQGYYKILS